MLTRIITGVFLVGVLAIGLYIGGVFFASLIMSGICISMFEVYRALKNVGNRPVQWPSWACLLVSIPLLVLTKNTSMLMLLATCACFCTCSHVLFRKEPKLDDLLSSIIPLFSVLLPGMCMVGLMRAEQEYLKNMLILLCFGIPLLGDTLAYFISSRFGKRKLCPHVSPNKSVEGAIAGLMGSMIFAGGSWYVFGMFGQVPPLWHFLILGVIGGFAGQIGDLYASLIKRHCKIKDFGTIFPGHGGMMDRLDSTFFASVVVYIYFGIAILK